MDDLGSRLTQILEDPARIQQIMEAATSMGLSVPEQTETSELPTPETIRQITQTLSQTKTKDRRQETLIKALLPYLRPSRQTRLERAMQLSQLSRLAGAALQNGTFSFLQSQEEHDDV